MVKFTESVVEEAALEWLSCCGWEVAHGPDIAPSSDDSERSNYSSVVLERRLRDALALLNPELPPLSLDDAFRTLTNPVGATLVTRNRNFHRMLRDGVTVEYRCGGTLRGAQVRAIDFEMPHNNNLVAVNQFTVVENNSERRPDLVLFVNGLPLAIIELKNPADEDATIWTAWQQLQTYKAELSNLFVFNAVLVVSDGVDARMGTLTAGREWFKPWRTIEGNRLVESQLPQLQITLAGAMEPSRFISLIQNFIVFEDDGALITKKLAGYHQFEAVRKAVEQTIRAANLRKSASTSARSIEKSREKI